MTVLDVAKAVALKVGVEVPSQLFAATDREYVEMRTLINEAATDLRDVYDWHLLRTINTVTGDGTSTSFALPSDYARMMVTASVWSSRYLWAMEHIVDTDRWLEYLTLPYTQENGIWTIYGGEFHILAAMGSGETAKFFYISNLIVAPNSGSNKTAFTADDDTFRLSEKLLALLTVVKWRAQKQQAFDEDLALYNIDLNATINRDSGSKPILSGSRPVSWKSRNIAWPGSVTP